ncbi:succinate dehydrogenase, cytochrome b556 subunit [Herminiimonas sp.]|jgi:succinate dehydrogenase / fumarate reductase cytochrome b subunit|uniref:succinate dehydrogenase, cytochrome b556 subunit n=1 Tax=Herminiimonas sp. TaxID=1926289 RepID=UPI0027218C46|nr:succinate dehydrogenase, cytochrome b556 subunit [Herminiimonas sp.]MDO8306212.1 succinate dehydrogenase, cytochrome b556 subunit [Herminiimonas sp.]
MSDALKTGKPQFRNINITDLVRYRMPLAAIISILHRISGALLFVLLPLILLLLDKSLLSEISFEYFKGIVSHWFVKLVILALTWAYLHHFCAGIRHLLMDVHVGVDKHKGRKSAAIVLSVSLPLTALIALKLFGAF